MAKPVSRFRGVYIIQPAALIRIQRHSFRRLTVGISGSGSVAHSDKHFRAAIVSMDCHHVLLLADDVSTLGPSAQFYRGLGGQPPPGRRALASACKGQRT